MISFEFYFPKEVRCKGGNRDYYNHSSVIFETTSKFVIAFVRLTLEKVWVDGFTVPQR